MRAIAGIQSHSSGSIFLNGQQLHYRTVSGALRNGIGYVPEDRKVQALCLGLGVGDNLALTSMRCHQKLGFINFRKENKQARQMVELMTIRTPSLLQEVGNLSGGNQQKVSIGKTLGGSPKVVLLNEPTRGIDVEAKQEIYKLIRQLANSGVAVLIYTSDMMETIGLCDRIITLYEGRITGELTGSNITEEKIMAGAMNLNSEEAAS